MYLLICDSHSTKYVHVKSLHCTLYWLVAKLCLTFCDPVGSSLSGSSVHGFLRQDYWRGLTLFFPGTLQFSSVQSLSRVQLFVTPWTAPRQASLSSTNSQSLLKLMSIELVMPSNHLILCWPLLLLPPIFPSIRVFSSESGLPIRSTKYWSFSFSISPSNEHSGPITFRMDWLDLLAVQGTLKSLFQHHSSKASILQCSAFFIVQLSHPYMTTGKTIALMRQTFVGKVMSLLFNMLSRLVITFLSRSKCLFISWLQSLSVVNLEPPKIKSVTVSSFLIYLPWSDGTRCHEISFLNVESSLQSGFSSFIPGRLPACNFQLG